MNGFKKIRPEKRRAFGDRKKIKIKTENKQIYKTVSSNQNPISH